MQAGTTKVNPTHLSARKVKSADGYFTQLPAIIYIPDVMTSVLIEQHTKIFTTL